MKKLILLLAFSYAGNAAAHHAFAADYEAGNEGVIEGVITEVIYKNPHARYYLEVQSEDGGTETWDLQTMNLMMLGRVGWKKDTLKVGDNIRVEGILGRNNTKRMSINVVTHEDGRVISPQRGIRQTNADLSARNTADTPAVEQEFRSLAANISSGAYELEENHAYLGFSYSHLGLSKPQLQFADFDADLNLNGIDMASSSVSITVDAASVVTAVPELDDMLKGADFFDVANHPRIDFASTAYQETAEDSGVLTGELSVAGVTKPVTLDVKINQAAMNPLNRREMIGFAASGTVSRSEFGMGGFEQMVADELELNIQVEFQKVR